MEDEHLQAARAEYPLAGRVAAVTELLPAARATALPDRLFPGAALPAERILDQHGQQG
jgi:hypothetical protein